MRQRGLLRPILLVVLALFAGYLVVREGTVQTATRLPASLLLASRLAPADPEILTLAAKADMLKSVAAEQASGKAATSLLPADSPALQQGGEAAYEALVGDLTQVEALAVYGAAANARGDQKAAGAIMRASDSLSRRNLLTRLWLIEDAAKREQLPEMLQHIDVALRVSATAQNQMFPFLARALAEPGLVPDFVRILRREPPWTEAFLYTAATSGFGTKNLAKIYLALGKDYEYQGQELSALLMEQLVAQKAYAEAFEFERGLTGTRSIGTEVTDPAFAKHEGLEPLTWLLTSTADFDAARSTDSFGNTGLDLLSSGSGAGVVARQLLALRPGRYRFSNSVTSDYGEVKLELEWRLRCAADDAVLGRFVVLEDKSESWTVPSSCGFQWLELYADAAGTVSSETVFVRPVRLERLGQGQSQAADERSSS
ncbi:hypothetical protein [Tsuneonella sp. HG222]